MPLTRSRVAWLALALLGGCSTAVPGTDAAQPADDAYVAPDAGPPTWSTIYADYFGPGAVSQCGASSGCHASATATGAVVSNFVCADSAGCYATMTGAAHLVRPSDVAMPQGAPLFHSLRVAGGAGRMPLNVSFTFGPSDVARIQAWIARGAMND